MSINCFNSQDLICSSDDYGTMVTVRVGETKKEFQVYKGLITHHSEYFNRQFSGRWGNDTTVDFSEADEITFKAFFHLMFTRRITANPERTVRRTDRMTTDLARLTTKDDTDTTDEGHSAKDERKEEDRYTRHDLCRMWTLADFIECPPFKAVVMDAIRDRIIEDFTIPFDLVDYVYNNTPDNCGLRRLLVDSCTKTAADNWALFFENDRDALHKDFLLDVVKRLHIMRAENLFELPWSKHSWKESDKCLYHDHPVMRDATSVVDAGQ